MRFMKTQTGFTLIETVVAISVLMLGVVGPLSLAQRNLKASRSASDRLVASFLAQEGIEAVRSAIANNSADTSDPSEWLDGVTNPPGAQCDKTHDHCIVDVTLGGTNLLARCNGQCTPMVYQNSGTFVYRQLASAAPGAPWVPTQFQRLVSVDVYPGDTKRVVASTTVWWRGGNLTLQEDIYNWFIQIN